LIIQEKIFLGEKSGELSELRRIWQPTKESAVRISMLAAVGEETFLVWE
jgi:hypothetical protein